MLYCDEALVRALQQVESVPQIYQSHEVQNSSHVDRCRSMCATTGLRRMFDDRRTKLCGRRRNSDVDLRTCYC